MTESVKLFTRARVKGTAKDQDYDALMAEAVKRAPDPTVFEEYPAVFWNAIVSNNTIDFYSTSMARETLDNFANGLTDGVSFQDSHNTRQNGMGQSLAGEVIDRGGRALPLVGEKLTEVNGTFFTLDGWIVNGIDTKQFLAAIRAGVWKDVSVGFHARDITCSICGKQVFEWWKEDGCSHFPGMEYDIEGKKVKAWARINDGVLSEVSQVFDGATTGAGVSVVTTKANDMALDRSLRPEDRAVIERMYPSVRLADPGGLYQLGQIDRVKQSEEGDEDMAGRQRSKRNVDDNVEVSETVIEDDDAGTVDPVVDEGAGTVVDPVVDPAGDNDDEAPSLDEETVIDEEDEDENEDEERGVVNGDVLAAERARLAEHGIRLGTDPVAAVRALSDALLKSRDKVRSLSADAKVGRQYREDMVKEAVDEAIRAKGEDLDEAKFRRMLEKLDLDEIREVRDDYAERAKAFVGNTPPVTSADGDGEGENVGTRARRSSKAHRA